MNRRSLFSCLALFGLAPLIRAEEKPKDEYIFQVTLLSYSEELKRVISEEPYYVTEKNSAKLLDIFLKDKGLTPDDINSIKGSIKNSIHPAGETIILRKNQLTTARIYKIKINGSFREIFGGLGQ